MYAFCLLKSETWGTHLVHLKQEFVEQFVSAITTASLYVPNSFKCLEKKVLPQLLSWIFRLFEKNKCALIYEPYGWSSVQLPCLHHSMILPPML